MPEQLQAAQQLVPVRLLGAPVRLWERSREYHEGLTREFALLALGDPESRHVPARLLNLVSDVSREYGAFTHDAEAQLARARSVGSVTVDLEYHVPPGVVPHARALMELLDQADRFCAAGDLLTLTTPEAVRAFRTWYFGEFTRQPVGEPPTPWQGPLW